MTTGTHRKTVSLPRIPVAHIVTGLLLLALTVAMVAGLAMLGDPPAGASTASYLRPAVTAGRTLACDWHKVHRMDRYTTWQYVTPALARYEHIGRCSKVIVGTGQSVIVGEDGHVADVS